MVSKSTKNLWGNFININKPILIFYQDLFVNSKSDEPPQKRVGQSANSRPLIQVPKLLGRIHLGRFYSAKMFATWQINEGNRQADMKINSGTIWNDVMKEKMFFNL